MEVAGSCRSQGRQSREIVQMDPQRKRPHAAYTKLEELTCKLGILRRYGQIMVDAGSLHVAI
jgi:hypothetical protein